MIFVSDKAKDRVLDIMKDSNKEGQPDYFLRVSVVGGGCSGLSYKMDFDNELKSTDQVFEHNGVKVVTDLKSFLYLVNTTLEYSLRVFPRRLRTKKKLEISSISDLHTSLPKLSLRHSTFGVRYSVRNP